MFRKSDNISKIRDLVNQLPIRDADVFRMREILEETLNVSTDGYWDWDIPNNKEFLSLGFKQQLGYKDHEMENIPEAWQKLIHPDDLIEALNQFKAHVDSRGESPFKLICRYTHKDGHEVRVLCRGSVIEWGENNKPIRMVGTHIDITNL